VSHKKVFCEIKNCERLFFKVKASSALVWVQRLESDEYFPFVTSEATFDHKMDTGYGVVILVST